MHGTSVTNRGQISGRSTGTSSIPRAFKLYAKDLVCRNENIGEYQSNLPCNGNYDGPPYNYDGILNEKGKFWLNKTKTNGTRAIEFQEYCLMQSIEFIQNQNIHIYENDYCVVGLCVNTQNEVINSCVTSPFVLVCSYRECPSAHSIECSCKSACESSCESSCESKTDKNHTRPTQPTFVLTHTGSIYKLGRRLSVESILKRFPNMYKHIKPEYKHKYPILVKK